MSRQSNRASIRHVCLLFGVALIFGIAGGCVSGNQKKQSPAFARKLGYAGCQVSGPLTEEEILEMRRKEDIPPAHWEKMRDSMLPGDSVYYFECINVGRDRIATGITFYGIVRDFAVVGKIEETILD
jgi:hypothetical protein